MYTTSPKWLSPTSNQSSISHLTPIQQNTLATPSASTPTPQSPSPTHLFTTTRGTNTSHKGFHSIFWILPSQLLLQMQMTTKWLSMNYPICHPRYAHAQTRQHYVKSWRDFKALAIWTNASFCNCYRHLIGFMVFFGHALESSQIVCIHHTGL